MSTNATDADLIANTSLLPLEPLPIPGSTAVTGTDAAQGGTKGSSANAGDDEAMNTGDEDVDNDGNTQEKEERDDDAEEEGDDGDTRMDDGEPPASISLPDQNTGTAFGRTPSGGQPSPLHGQGRQSHSLRSASLFQLLDLDQLTEHVRAGTLPPNDHGPRGIQDALPARYSVPPEHTLGGNSFIVGVPAGARAHHDGAFLREGYGGLEAMMMFEGLSEADLQHLCDLIGDPVEVRELVLRPYFDQDTPSLASLEALLGSLIARREFASLLMHFPVHQLAQKVFYTVSLIHHLLARDRQRQAIFDNIDGESPAAELLQLRTKYDLLKRDVVFLDEYYRQQLKSAEDDSARVRATLDSDFKRLARENLEETSALQERVDELEGQLAQANTQIAHLQRSAQETRFDAAGLMDFLNSRGTEVRGNWPRLRKLFRRFQNGTIPPGDWRTWITVEAVDKPYRMYPPYPGPLLDDSDDDEGDAGDGSQEEKTEDSAPPARISVATPPKRTRQSSPGSSKSGSGRGSSTKKAKAVQRRPSVHSESQVGPRSSKFPLKLSVQEACALLPEFVAWQDLRPDVQWTMRSGVEYDEAVDTLGLDQVNHRHFHRDSLLKMLATMMYHRKLDVTPWAKYVPVSYYRMADIVLDDWLDTGYVPPAWPPLRNLAEDLAENAEGSSSSSEDDKGTDPDYDNGNAADEDDDDEGDEVEVVKVTPAPAETKTGESDDDDSSSSSSTDDEPARKPKRKASSQTVQSSSDSSSESSGNIKPKKLVFVPSPKRPRRSRSNSTSAKKSGSLRSRARSELGKRKSPLARKKYDELTPAELAMIEQPTKGVLSWRRRGVLTQYTPKKNGHENQTPGFPEYCPYKGEGGLERLYARWPAVEAQYARIVAEKPWAQMFKDRVKVFYFHKRSELPAKSFIWIDEYLRYVRDHAEVFWYMLHWFCIKIKAAKGEKVDPLKYLLANTLYERRRELHENIGRGMQDRVKRYIKKGVPASVFEEPGIWVYPAKICYMYLTDSSTLNAQGNPYSLAEQIEMAERAEPGRTQWTYYCSDSDRMAHISHDLRLRELSPKERAANPISLTVE